MKITYNNEIKSHNCVILTCTCQINLHNKVAETGFYRKGYLKKKKKKRKNKTNKEKNLLH